MRRPTRARRLPALLAPTIALALPIALACSDEGPWHTPASARLVGANVVSLAVGGSHEFAVECLNEYGQLLPRTRTAWRAVDGFVERQGRVTLDWRGNRARVRGISEGTVFLMGECIGKFSEPNTMEEYWYQSQRRVQLHVEVTASADSAWTLDAVGDTLRLRAPSLEDSLSGVTRLLTARSGIGTLSALDPASLTWTSDHPDVATVAATGLVRARGLGATTVRVARGDRTLEVAVRVDSGPPAQAWDIALVDAHWTQGAQDAAQGIPIVRNGRAAAVNVTAFASPGAPAASVSLEVWNAAGALVHRASTALQPTVDSAPSFAAPSAQFLVPRAVVRVAARWRVVRDTAAAPDAEAANDAWPRTGTAPLSTIEAAPLRLRLVPLRFAGNNNHVTPIPPEARVFYDSIPRIRLPISEVTVTVEPPLTVPHRIPTDAEFEADPTLVSALYQMHLEILEAVDKLRLASGAGREDYWVGVVPKPSPDSRTSHAALGYVPSRPSDTGPMSRTMTVWGHDWRESPLNTGYTVAHELGHNLGLWHAPCGGATQLDAAYPVAGGGVGEWVHWVSAWEHGSATHAATIAPDRGDLMSYCSSGFAGPYHTRAMIEWRLMADASLMAPIVPTRVLAVRGLVSGAELIVRTPEIIDAEPVLGQGGDVTVELLAADGRVLAEASARTGALAESADVPFVVQIPFAPAWAGEVASVRVRSARLGREIITPIS